MYPRGGSGGVSWDASIRIVGVAFDSGFNVALVVGFGSCFTGVADCLDVGLASGANVGFGVLGDGAWVLLTVGGAVLRGAAFRLGEGVGVGVAVGVGDGSIGVADGEGFARGDGRRLIGPGAGNGGATNGDRRGGTSLETDGFGVGEAVGRNVGAGVGMGVDAEAGWSSATNPTRVARYNAALISL